MAMSDRKVLAAIDDGRIIVEPFDRKRLSTSSYDVRLGAWFFREQEPPLARDIFNIYDQDQVRKVWGSVEQAKIARETIGATACQEVSLDPEAHIILIEPGETILAHTQEFIGGRRNITTMMKARSSLGRSFITVCKCAGWGDVGCVNRWTMEITNVSRHYAAPLIVGSRIAQIVFIETGDIEGEDYASTGAYQNTGDIVSLMREWDPHSMLPRNRP